MALAHSALRHTIVFGDLCQLFLLDIYSVQNVLLSWREPGFLQYLGVDGHFQVRGPSEKIARPCLIMFDVD